MIEITDTEFEQRIVEVIDGKISRGRLAKELKADWRTLNNKIQLLSMSNPELYRKYIEKCSYRPKEITTLPLKTMLVEFLTTDINMPSLAAKYHIGERTLRRKINALKNSDDLQDRELYDLVKQTAYNHSHKIKTNLDLQRRIEELEIDQEEIVQDDKEKRRQQLIQIERRYNELCALMPKEKAAKIMGYTNNRIYKLLNELYCIEIQNNSLNEFKRQLQVTQKDLNNEHIVENKTKKIVEQEREQ